jgi:hypothetical protein
MEAAHVWTVGIGTIFVCLNRIKSGGKHIAKGQKMAILDNLKLQ